MATRRLTNGPAGTLVVPAIIGCVSVLPFPALELVNRRRIHEGFPIPLFGFLWLLPTAFIVVLTPMVRNALAGAKILANPLDLLLRVVVLAFIAWMWGGIVMDQLPCFLGVPNFD